MSLDPWEQVNAAVEGGQFLVRPDEGAIPTPSGDMVNVLLEGDKTRGLTSFLEYRLAARSEGPPNHYHSAFDELFYVVSGRLGMRTGDIDDEVGPRTFVFIPRGVPHTFWNPTDEDCVFVSAWSPAGAEQAWLLAHHLMDEYGATNFEGMPQDELARLVTISDSVAVIAEDGERTRTVVKTT